MLLAMPVLAEGPSACDPREDPTVCELKVERNNAMDELAVTAGALRKARERQVTMTEWWAEYAAGVSALSEWWRKYAEGIHEKKSQHLW
jgi:hypothetical protein